MADTMLGKIAHGTLVASAFTASIAISGGVGCLGVSLLTKINPLAGAVFGVAGKIFF